MPEAEKLKVKLRAVGASGGMGKSLALFLENPTGSVLLSTNQILAHFDEIEDEIKVVVFQKFRLICRLIPLFPAVQIFSEMDLKIILFRALLCVSAKC